MDWSEAEENKGPCSETKSTPPVTISAHALKWIGGDRDARTVPRLTLLGENVETLSTFLCAGLGSWAQDCNLGQFVCLPLAVVGKFVVIRKNTASEIFIGFLGCII